MVKIKNNEEIKREKMKLIKTYIPHYVVKYFKRQMSPLSDPISNKILASILFIDISGFTSLNERLGKIGKFFLF